MGNIYFLRHNRLSLNYGDYKKLSYKNAGNLMSLRSSPDIIKNIPENDFLKKIDFKNIDFVLTSNQRRTYNTAKLLGFSDYKKTDKLNMKFTLYELGVNKNTDSEYIKMARKNIFLYLQSRKGSAKYDDMYENISHVLAQCLDYNNSLVISHAFLLKFIYSFLVLGKSKNNIGFDDFDSINPNYMDGFIVNDQDIKNFLGKFNF